MHIPMSPDCAPYTMLKALPLWHCHIPTRVPRGKSHHYSHLTDEKAAEAQRGRYILEKVSKPLLIDATIVPPSDSFVISNILGGAHCHVPFPDSHHVLSMS